MLAVPQAILNLGEGGCAGGLFEVVQDFFHPLYSAWPALVLEKEDATDASTGGRAGRSRPPRTCSARSCGRRTAVHTRSCLRQQGKDASLLARGGEWRITGSNGQTDGTAGTGHRHGIGGGGAGGDGDGAHAGEGDEDKRKAAAADGDADADAAEADDTTRGRW